jgi:protein SCO1/2
VSGDAGLVKAALRGPDPSAGLVALLDERAPHFAGRTTADVEHLRGLALAAFEGTGLPPVAVSFVLEELESGRNPSNVAAAARALRGGSAALPAGAPALLVGAVARLRADDDRVRFPVGGAPPTALTDLADTLQILGSRASSAVGALEDLLAAHGDELSPDVRAKMAVALDAIRAPGCCRSEAPAPAPCCGDPASPAALGDTTRVHALSLEDQDGHTQTFAERFAGRPTAVAFFYTRCANPERCSLTVTRLAGLDRRLRAEGIDANVAGISYDTAYDRPQRLRTYGADRGMAFSPRCSLLRTVDAVDPLVEAFGLNVGFGPVTVNQHGLDLVLLDSQLAVVGRRTRRLWTEDDVIDVLAASQSGRGTRAPTSSSVGVGVPCRP